jgi:glycosylphosphatidylinositol transamidase (GPIT) subunit GPI8
MFWGFSLCKYFKASESNYQRTFCVANQRRTVFVYALWKSQKNTSFDISKIIFFQNTSCACDPKNSVPGGCVVQEKRLE